MLQSWQPFLDALILKISFLLFLTFFAIWCGELIKSFKSNFVFFLLERIKTLTSFFQLFAKKSWNKTFLSVRTNDVSFWVLFADTCKNDPIILMSYRVCHGFRLTKQDDYLWANFDHFWIEPYFWRQLGQLNIGLSLKPNHHWKI